MIREIAMREIRTRGRTRAYRVITAILLLVAIAAPVAVVVWPSGGSDTRGVDVAIVEGSLGSGASGGGGIGEASQADRQVALDVFGGDRIDFTQVALADDSAEAIDAALLEGDADVVIAPGPELVWKSQADGEVAAILSALIEQTSLAGRAETLGIEPGELNQLLTPTAVGERIVGDDENTEGIRTTMAFVGLLMAFMLPQVFGNLALMGVVEEKSTRVVEVLLSHVTPRALLTGKVLGIAALAIVQLVIVIAGLVAALALTSDIQVPSEAWGFLPILALGILGGLAIYTTLFALLGSLISRQEDASQVMLPAFLPIMGGYFAGQAAIIGSADSLLAKVLSYFPLTSPMLLPVRVAKGQIEGWEIAVSLGLLALGIWVLLWAAGRMYEFALLHTGARVGWGEAASRLLGART